MFSFSGAGTDSIDFTRLILEPIDLLLKENTIKLLKSPHRCWRVLEAATASTEEISSAEQCREQRLRQVCRSQGMRAIENDVWGERDRESERQR